MVAPAARRLVTDQRANGIEVNIGTTLFSPSTPATEPNDLVVFLPVTKRVVGSMDNHKATTAGHVVHKSLLRLARPGSTVVIGYDHVVVSESRLELRIRATLGRPHNVHREQVCLLQVALHHLGCTWPDAMIVLTLDN